MFERIFTFLKSLPKSAPNARHLTADDSQIAAAALLIHVIKADGEKNAEEQAGLASALSSAYNLHGAELKSLMKVAEEAEASAVDVYSFTSVLMRYLDEDARAEFIRYVWEIVLADGEMHELEENLVWRIAELIEVDTRVRMTMRQRVIADREGGI